MTTEEYIDRMLEASKKKYELLKDILAVTRSQSSAITEDGMDGLNRLIDDKQKKIDAINKLDEEFEVYFKRLKTSAGIKKLEELQPGLNGAGELKEAVGLIVELIREISLLEKANNAKAKALLDEFGGKTKRISQGRQMNSAYNPVPLKPPSYFIDKKK